MRHCRRLRIWRAPGGVSAERPYSHVSRPISRVLDGMRHVRMRDGHSSGTPVARRLKQPTRTAGSGHNPEARAYAPLRAVPIRSCSRWGLPCRRRCRRRGALLPHHFTLTAANANMPRRYVFCGTVPGFAPAGCYPAPFVRGARTFPLRQPFGSAGAAVRPTDSNRDGDIELARQVARPNNHAATLRIRVRRAASRSGRERRWSGCGRGWQTVPAMYCVSMGRRCRRRVPAGSGAERQSRPRT